MSVFSSITKGISKVIDPVADIVGSALNSVTGVNSQMDKSYEQQKATMEDQNAYNMYMWNLANEYNSPASQLARMKDAGIDVNPIAYALGSGNLSNTAGTVGSASGFSGSGSPAGNPISMALGVASGLQGIKESKARVDNMGKQNKNLTGVIESTKLENDIRRHNLKIARDTNTPVNSMPGLTQALVHTGTSLWKDSGASDYWRWLTTDSTRFPVRK